MNAIITNGTLIKERIMSEFMNARSLIYVAMAWFTDRDIADTIIGAWRRGVKVEIILSSNAQNETVKQMFKDAGITVHAFETGDERGIMHHKFSLIDHKISINGSYNYSYNASNNNVENIHICDDTGVYRQLLAEFERLKYNIDHEISVNMISTETTPLIETEIPLNPASDFSNKLQNLIFSTVHIDTDHYRQMGFQTSERTKGSIDIFKVEFDKIRNELNSHATDDSLGGKKNTLISQITNAFEDVKAEIEAEKNRKMEYIQSSFTRTIDAIRNQINQVVAEKRDLEIGSETSLVKGLLSVNKEIERNRHDRKILDESIITRKFWTFDTVLVLSLVSIFFVYLSIFFSSAFYKVFFEGQNIRNAMELGLTPEMPKLINAHALSLLYKNGFFYGFIGTFFFLIPVLLTNLNLIGSRIKIVNYLGLIVGLIVFDLIVALYIAVTTHEINNLLKGINSEILIREAIWQKEFWMIFIFGSIPLTITHFLIENITNRYKKSREDLMDEEKFHRIQILEKEYLELNAQKELLEAKISDKKDQIRLKEEELTRTDSLLLSELEKIIDTYAERFQQVKTVFDDYHAKIISGIIFTEVIHNKVSASYKAGFVDFLPRFYATSEVTNRVNEIDRITELNSL